MGLSWEKHGILSFSRSCMRVKNITIVIPALYGKSHDQTDTVTDTLYIVNLWPNFQ